MTPALEDRGAPLTIAIVATSLEGGGAEFVTRTWAKWLADQGHVVRLVMLSQDPPHPDIPGTTATSLAALSQRGKATALRALLRAERPDVVLAIQSYPAVVAFAATRYRGAPALVTSERNITMREGERAPLRDRVMRALASRAFRGSDLVIAVSHPVGAVLIGADGVDPALVRVVPNPSPARDAPASATRGGVADDALTIVVPGRLVAQKRTELAVDAARVLADRGIPSRVVCYGRGPNADRIREHAEALGVELDLAGWVPDWAGAAPAGSIALLPSYREGFGNVLVDATRAGIRNVAISSAFGVSDAVVPGLTGELALTGEPGAVADAVLRARRIPVPLDDRGWVERFSVDNSGALLVAALRSAIRRRGGRR